MEWKTVLIVDDNLESAITLKEFLQAQGFKCLLASSAKEALGLINEDVGVAVLDVDLPDIDGFTLLKVLKGKKPDMITAVISAHSSWENKSRALELGADFVFAKPLNLSSFIEELKEKFKKGAAK